MESAKEQVKINYVFNARIMNLAERFKPVYQGGTGKEAYFKDVSIGWYMHLQGSFEAIYIGLEKPNLQAGQLIKITMEPVDA